MQRAMYEPVIAEIGDKIPKLGFTIKGWVSPTTLPTLEDHMRVLFKPVGALNKRVSNLVGFGML